MSRIGLTTGLLAMLIGPGFGRLLPTSALIGAGYMMLANTAAQTIATTEVPLGILTAVIGAPVFKTLLGLLPRLGG